MYTFEIAYKRRTSMAGINENHFKLFSDISFRFTNNVVAKAQIFLQQENCPKKPKYNIWQVAQ